MTNSCIAFFNRRAEEKAYRAYVTESLRAIADNTARFSGGMLMPSRFADIYDDKPHKSGDEIVDDVLSRCGFERGEDE